MGGLREIKLKAKQRTKGRRKAKLENPNQRKILKLVKCYFLWHNIRDDCRLVTAWDTK